MVLQKVYTDFLSWKARFKLTLKEFKKENPKLYYVEKKVIDFFFALIVLNFVFTSLSIGKVQLYDKNVNLSDVKIIIIPNQSLTLNLSEQTLKHISETISKYENKSANYYKWND